MQCLYYKQSYLRFIDLLLIFCIEQMSQKDEALLSWFSHSLGKEFSRVQQLANPIHFYHLCQKIKDFDSFNVKQCENTNDWKKRYRQFKNLQAGLQSYYKNVLGRPLPMMLTPFNYLQIAKGQDNQGLINILTILFIGCISSDQKAMFLQTILSLEEMQKEELMHLIQYDSNYLQKYHSEQEQLEQSKRKIEELELSLQSLYIENQSLRDELFIETEQQKKLQSLVTKLEEEKRSIRKQLEEKNYYFEDKMEKHIQKQNQSKLITQKNEQILEELKKDFLEQEKKYVQQISQLKQKIEQMKQTIQVLEEKNIQLEETGLRVVRNVGHQNCVSLGDFKARTDQLQDSIKKSQVREIQLQRKIFQLDNQLSESARKIDKLTKQRFKYKQQYKKDKSRGQPVNKKNGIELQAKFLNALKEDLIKRTKERVDK